MIRNQLICGDCLEIMPQMPEDSVDLIFGSSPYEDARTYGIGFNLKGQDWVDWMVEVYKESARICKGLVAFVVQGRTRNYKWSATPALLMADLYRAGFNVRNPAIYSRVGIPGSGGPDWLRSDYEWIVCTTPKGKLSWSDNTACGAPPKWDPGGEPSHRMKNGRMVKKIHTKRTAQGILRTQGYNPPKLVNPGNIVHCNVGGGLMGSALASENEAPFPLDLAEFFVKSFCAPQKIVLDPFCGSSTTGHACIKNGRQYIGIDLREGQIELSRRRLDEAEKEVKE